MKVTNPKPVKSAIGAKGNDEGGKFVPRNLLSTSPLKEQFEPTSAEPVRQRFKMAGGC
jgi:hypothetical protein